MGDLSYPMGRIGELVIEDDSDEGTLLVSQTVPHPEGQPDKHFLLTRGVAERTKDVRHELQRVNENHQREVVADANDAIATYLGWLEANTDLSEHEALKLLKSVESLDMDAYESYRTSFSKKERARRAIEDSKERIKTFRSPVDSAIFQDRPDYTPSWRDTAPDDDTVALAERILRQIDRNRRSCYQTAFQALQKAPDERVEYCEGLALSKHPGRVSTHAWVELDGSVVELTWPWNGINPPDECVYYGDSIDKETVHAVHKRRPTFASVLMPDEVYYEQQDVKRALMGRFE